MKKIKYVRLESLDGEIHFQECEAASCLNAKEYNIDEALELAKTEAKRPLFLNRKTHSVTQ